jgi:hypothetical protein
MFCTKCGIQNPNHAKFCLGCGIEMVALSSVVQQHAAPNWSQRIKKWSRRAVWASLGLSLVVAMVVGALDSLQPAKQNIVGTLYAENFPFIDIAADRESLARWNALEEIKDDQEQLVQYATLVKEEKVFPVAPGTGVQVIQVTGADCSVNITTGKEAGKTGWVSCWMVKRQ